MSATWLRELVEHIGHKIDVAVLLVKHIGRKTKPSPGMRMPVSLTTSLDEGVHTVYVRGRSFVPREMMAWLGFQRLRSQWGMPDVVHAHLSYPAGYLAAKLCKRKGIPLIVTEHFTEFSSFKKKPRRLARVRWALHQAALVTAPSQALASEIEEACPGVSVRRIPNMVDDSMFHLGPPVPFPPVRILTLSYMRAEKGLKYLLDAVALLKQRNVPSFRVDLAGDGSERSALEQQARKLDLENQCRFLGACSRERVVEAIQQCHFFVLPSLRETFSIVTIEAMACGKPVIATPCGGPEELVTPETGLLVPSGNSEALADAIEKMLRTHSHYNAQAIRKHVQASFGANAIVEKWLETYREVQGLKAKA